MSRDLPPVIAILLDENTSTGGTAYEAHKGYFASISNAGGLAFGIPYDNAAITYATNSFDGLLITGGAFAYPEEMYVGNTYPWGCRTSNRYAHERRIAEAFLDADKPILGICAGMQMLACLYGGKLHGSVAAISSPSVNHFSRDQTHGVVITPGTRLAEICAARTLQVNSFHNEAVGEVSSRITVSALSTDGVIEAIEIPERSFAVGLQWHQERHVGDGHAGGRVFEAFVEAARRRRDGAPA